MEYYDPLRRKNVTATPEEQVRQWFIEVLRNDMKVPVHMMMSEVGFKFGGKQYRADLIVYGRDGSPLAVVECKRPEVELDREVTEQALRYDMVLSVRWIFLTNGKSTRVYRRQDGNFVAFGSLPKYEEMAK